MRGVVSAGMVAGLEDAGFGQVFDAVYGSSAGALNGAYFLAGQAAFGARIYSEDINNRRFIDLSRPLRGQPIVDLDYLIDDVTMRRKTLRVDRVLESATPLVVMATDVASARPTPLDHFADARALRSALRAGARMPVIAGGPITHEGRTYLDASLSEPVPVVAAEMAGFTHVLALLTRPAARERQLSWFDRCYVLPRLRRISTDLAALYEHRFTPYAALLDQIETGFGPAGRARVQTIRPASVVVSKLERRAEVLVAAAAQGRDAVRTVLTMPTTSHQS
jgi:predicted patatin/cPLA2 family phospholipase